MTDENANSRTRRMSDETREMIKERRKALALKKRDAYREMYKKRGWKIPSKHALENRDDPRFPYTISKATAIYRAKRGLK